ncbi:unnamed protein product [Rangifer tarandus platyrhynchus]|uniref:Uncharacterized protein n=1 Tax=Rangifer tarandus platyrhynchus TaxID=3082113 RepID=A0AC59Z9W0_RANTA
MWLVRERVNAPSRPELRPQRQRTPWAQAMENLMVSTMGTGVQLCYSTVHEENQTAQFNLLLNVYTMLITVLSAASVRRESSPGPEGDTLEGEDHGL